MFVKYEGKDKSTIVYKKGSTQQEVMDFIEKRIEHNKKELFIYERFYKRYLSIEKALRTDESWLNYLKAYPDWIQPKRDSE